MPDIRLPFDNSYARDLPGFYVPWNPQAVREPRLLHFNHGLAEELGLSLGGWQSQDLAEVFSGNRVPEGAFPIAQAYAGHQFGHYSPQLGDGRALLLGEVVDRRGRRRDIAFKGSGRTPFARRGDGRAAVGPMLREVLLGEAMYALGIPTTRALAVVATGEPVYRERPLPGAVLTRVADSHLRVGTFEFFAASGDLEKLRRLADYAVARHDPGLTGRDDRHLAFLEAVCRRQAALMARWMGVGFIHGVMNTDNMSLSGETIDYGPCAFLEAYDPATVFSSIDEYGRYAYGNQPAIAQWNLARLAESLLPLLPGTGERAVADATAVIDAFPGEYRRRWLEEMRRKLDLPGGGLEQEAEDMALAEDWLGLLAAHRADFTLAWRRLSDAAEGNSLPLTELIPDQPALEAWLSRWQSRCAAGEWAARADGRSRADALRAANPRVIPRNHRVEEALADASDNGDLGPFQALLDAVIRPFDDAPSLAHFAEPAPSAFTGCYKTFCGT